MSERLRVNLGREGPKSVELTEDTIEVTGDFIIEVHNHGHPQHVHVAPERDLGRFVRVEAPNHFVENDELRPVHIEVDEERPEKFDGQLRVVTGYGTETTYVNVRLREDEPSRPRVAVDESLGKPPAEESGPEPLTEQLFGPGTVPLIALAIMAILIAAGAIMIATDVAVVLGVIAVLVGVGIAILLLLR